MSEIAEPMFGGGRNPKSHKVSWWTFRLLPTLPTHSLKKQRPIWCQMMERKQLKCKPRLPSPSLWEREIGQPARVRQSSSLTFKVLQILVGKGTTVDRGRSTASSWRSIGGAPGRVLASNLDLSPHAVEEVLEGIVHCRDTRGLVLKHQPVSLGVVHSKTLKWLRYLFFIMIMNAGSHCKTFEHMVMRRYRNNHPTLGLLGNKILASCQLAEKTALLKSFTY